MPTSVPRAQGIDPLELQARESARLGIDHWFRLSMNDWHHFDADSGSVYRLGGSQFYEERADLLIGEQGAADLVTQPGPAPCPALDAGLRT